MPPRKTVVNGCFLSLSFYFFFLSLDNKTTKIRSFQSNSNLQIQNYNNMHFLYESNVIDIRNQYKKSTKIHKTSIEDKSESKTKN
ncbi:hypothetical protein D0Y65_006317 [Glycine soja]|uniref:Uncharacterized protein n=2 Tax=Glycine subgen. Soja TaxID=1462606 RepID=A0A0R0KQ14_SOYBN|nr:hypothetical protein JHK87_006422 [Glycine soja]KAG5071361.1 hypothetical protein JHK86_006572 [Glycine max]RZC19440.1 hypothetical protein D0Y65_006317 [Glycine soja]